MGVEVKQEPPARIFSVVKDGEADSVAVARVALVAEARLRMSLA